MEIELAGLELDQLAILIQETVGGRIIKKSDYEALVEGTHLGDVRVEFDAALFRELRVRNFFEELETDILDDADKISLEKALASVAQWLVPFELVFEPLAVERLVELDQLRAVIGQNAHGTNSSLLYAFGLHFNPELPDLRIETVLRYLRAFFVLYEELKQAHGIDPIRSLSGFIGPFPRDYILLVLNAKYRPTKEQFIDDYLRANPTRNRPMDLLPLLAQMDERRVRTALPEEKISPRPTFHYRLPNSRIDEADWSITQEWAIWMRVDQLANDRATLAKRSRYELKRLQGPFLYWLKRLWRTKPLLSRQPMIAVTGPDKGGFPAWICTWLAVKRAGGRPMRLTPGMFLDDPSLPPFDGLILGGGADVDPVRYQDEFKALLEEEEPERTPRPFWSRILSRLIAPLLFLVRTFFSLSASAVDRERDEFEHSCLEKALREELPVLGICRGAQFINIRFGGDLHEDVTGFYGEVGRVSTLLPKRRVTLQSDSLLQGVLGRGRLKVNSLHRQGVRRLGLGLQVTARDDAQVVQAIEAVDGRFVLGVQWHPEYLPASRLQQRLFQALVREALSRKR